MHAMDLHDLRIDELPAVVGAAVTLRPIEPADADAWYGYLSMPEVLEHTSWRCAIDRNWRR
jgi:ribosomal-protein-alanine N-acetyltransferase